MAAHVTAIVNAVGRTIFRKAGRFISRNTYLREIRRIPKGVEGAGRFISKIQHAGGLTQAGLAQQLQAMFGPPIGGGNWVSRVRKSTERFIDLAAEGNAL